MERMYYRRRMNTYTWHFCENCPLWPGDDYHQTVDPGQWGDLCSECQSLLLRGSCTKKHGGGEKEGDQAV